MIEVKLSAHFSLAEMTQSEVAARAGLDNMPPASALANLVRLCGMLERIREKIGHPIIVTSGYRAPDVNALVGGSTNSAHKFGRAADIIAPSFGTPLALARAIEKSGVHFDQVIHEFGRWVHVSIPPEDHKPRLMALTIDREGTRSGLA